MRNDRKLFFRFFLIVYGVFLLVHVWEMGFDSWQVPTGILGGMAVALVAHKRHGYLPSLFLFGHMIIEWYHHALHGNHYDSGEITFHGIHAFLDIVFLHIEAKVHCQKYAIPLVIGVVVILLGIFVHYHIPTSYPAQIIEEGSLHGGETLHHVVIGGMLGCVLSHLFFKTETKRCPSTH